MDGFIDITLKAIAAFGIYAVVSLAYAGLGAYKNIKLWGEKFDWKKYAEGAVQWSVLGLSVLGIILSAYGVIALAPHWGIQLENAQQVAPPVIFGILAAGIAGMLLKCIGKIATIVGTSPEIVSKLQTKALENKDPNGLLILDVFDIPGAVNPPSTLEAEEDVEVSLVAKTVRQYLQELGEIGGKGAAASVPTNNWSSFRNAVIGKAYDIDGYYGAQCWDGAALFWLNAVGRSFSTGGTGAARGGWEAARSVNAGSEFDLITDRNQIQPGDWLVFGGTKWGHVGMAVSGNLGNYVRLLGENQGGDGNGAPFNEINMSLNNFLGAFRLKRWHNSPAPSPAPAPAPAPARKSNEEIAKEVKRGDWDNDPIRKQRLQAAGYDYNAIMAIVNGSQPAPATPPSNGDVRIGSVVQPTAAVDYNGTALAAFVTQRQYPVTELKGDRAVLGNGLNTAFHTGNLRVISQPDIAPAAAQPAPAPAPSFAVGDVVVPTSLVDYSGTKLQQWDDTYTITELEGDRAVLSARGSVWAAMHTGNLRKA